MVIYLPQKPNYIGRLNEHVLSVYTSVLFLIENTSNMFSAAVVCSWRIDNGACSWEHIKKLYLNVFETHRYKHWKMTITLTSALISPVTKHHWKQSRSQKSDELFYKHGANVKWFVTTYDMKIHCQVLKAGAPCLRGRLWAKISEVSDFWNVCRDFAYNRPASVRFSPIAFFSSATVLDFPSERLSVLLELTINVEASR